MRRSMVMLIAGLMASVCGATATGLAQTPAPAPTYDARFFVGADQTLYSGTTTFQVDAKNEVTGDMRLTVPTDVNGKLSGTVKDGAWTVRIDFEIPAQGCQGMVTGTAKVPPDLKIITGTIRVAGACAQDPIDAAFTFTKR